MLEGSLFYPLVFTSASTTQKNSVNGGGLELVEFGVLTMCHRGCASEGFDDMCGLAEVAILHSAVLDEEHLSIIDERIKFVRCAT